MMQRGFVTIATGNIFYYKMAFNLLRSFRLFHPDTPFAILCDRENEYTEAFTDVVLLKNVTSSYLDKFCLLTDCPYDENLFIEPDCLVYHSLDVLWMMLAKQYDFTSFGWNGCTPPFFSNPAYAAEKFLGNPDALVPCFTPGYMFIRKGKTCQDIYKDAKSIIEIILNDPLLKNDPELICKGSIRDDPVFSFAMARNGCECVETPDKGKCVFLPGCSELKAVSLRSGKLDVVWHRPLNDCNILHFSTRRAREEGLYLQQTIVLDLLCKGSNSLFIRCIESKPAYWFFHFYKKFQTRIKQK